MNLKTTIQTLRRIEQLLDGWQSSGEIPTIERDLARDLLRRAYEDILLSERNIPAETGQPPIESPAPAAAKADVAEPAEAVEPTIAAALAVEIASESAVAAVAATAAEEPAEAFVAEPAAERFAEESATEPDDGIIDSFIGTEDTPVVNLVSPIGLVGIASSDDSAEEATEEPIEEEIDKTEEELPANIPGDPIVESAEGPSEGSTEEATPEATEVLPEGPAAPTEEFAGIPAETPAEEETPAQETAATETAEYEEDTEVTEAASPVAAPAAVELVTAAVEIVAEPGLEPESEPDIEPAPEQKPDAGPEPTVKPELEAEPESAVEPKQEGEPESGQTAERNPEPTPVADFTAPAPAEPAAEETPANAAAAPTAETLEEMASRFKSVSGRRRKSRRAFFSLYEDDETARREAPNSQLELSDWGIEPSEPSSKIKHVRELFGLPVDDPETTPEPTVQPAADSAADSYFELEIADFTDDDPLLQRGQSIAPATPAPNAETKPASHPESRPTAAPTAKPTAVPTAEPTGKPMAAPTAEPIAEAIREDQDDDDLPFDEAVVALEDFDGIPSTVSPIDSSESSAPADPVASAVPAAAPVAPEVSERAGEAFEPIEIVEEITGETTEDKANEDNGTATADPTPVADHPAATATDTPRTPAAEPANMHGLPGREEKTEMPAATTVLGEVIGNDRPTVGDSLGHRPDMAEWVGVAEDLNRAISVGERFVLLRDLFGGDQALCDRTLKRLSTFDDLDDCMIWITENFAWNANSEGAKLIMRLLERKLG